MFILDDAELIYGWCTNSGVLTVFSIIKTLLSIIRFVIPIILVVVTSIDIFKNLIDPNSKDGLKVIGTRIIASIIIFFIPTVVNLIVKIVNVGLNDNDDRSYNATDCWLNTDKIDYYKSQEKLALEKKKKEEEKKRLEEEKRQEEKNNTGIKDANVYVHGILYDGTSSDKYYSDYDSSITPGNTYKSVNITFDRVDSTNEVYVCYKNVNTNYDRTCSNGDYYKDTFSLSNFNVGETYLIEYSVCNQFLSCNESKYFYVSLTEGKKVVQKADAEVLISGKDYFSNSSKNMMIHYSYKNATIHSNVMRSGEFKFNLLGGANNVKYCLQVVNGESGNCSDYKTYRANQTVSITPGFTYRMNFKGCYDNDCASEQVVYFSLDNKLSNSDSSGNKVLTKYVCYNSSGGKSDRCVNTIFPDTNFSNYKQIDIDVSLPNGYDFVKYCDKVVRNASDSCNYDKNINSGIITLTASGIHRVQITPCKRDGTCGDETVLFGILK